MGLLRIFLASVVLLFHCPPGVIARALHPALAVQCFYCISGFYMQLLIRQFQKNPGNWQIAFYKSRILRLFPTYYFILIITVLYSFQHYYLMLQAPASDLSIFLANNAFIFGQDIMRLVGLSWLTIMPQSWTLALELMFYCVAPFLLTKNNRIIVLVITGSVLCRLILNTYGLNYNGWLYGFFPSEISIFLLGSIGFRFYDKFLHNPSAFLNIVYQLIGLVALINLFHCNFYGWNYYLGEHWGGNWGSSQAAGVPYCYWYVLLLTAVSLPFIFKFSKNIKIDRHIGELSYPVYLGHFFVLFVLGSYVTVQYQSVVVLSVSIVASLLIYRFIELPVARYRSKLKTSQEVGTSAVDLDQDLQPILLEKTV